MAWPLAGQRSCLLVGDQMHFRKEWEDAGWRVVALDEVHGKGTRWLAGLLVRADIAKFHPIGIPLITCPFVHQARCPVFEPVVDALFPEVCRFDNVGVR